MKNYLLSGLLLSGILLSSCGDDDVPGKENEEEIINEITLTFSPEGGGQDIVATYIDADGEGVENPVLTEIDLLINTTYILSLTLENTLESPSEDITEEVKEEGDEHQFFFSWTTGVFSNPTGTGNINTQGTVEYQDEDGNGNPIGLSTKWTTSDSASQGGSFQILLQHQPNIKTATSTSSDGETDINQTWIININ